MLAMVRPDMCEDAVEVWFELVVAGRVVRLSARWAVGGRIGAVGVHNFGLNAAELRRVVAAAGCLAVEARADPARSLVVMVGDWNFLAPGVGYADVAKPESAPRELAARRGGQSTLQPILDGMTELCQPRATHTGDGACEARLDRADTPWFGFVLVLTEVRVQALGSLAEVMARGVSDHTPLVSVARRSRSGGTPVPASVLRGAAVCLAGRRICQCCCEQLGRG